MPCFPLMLCYYPVVNLKDWLSVTVVIGVFALARTCGSWDRGTSLFRAITGRGQTNPSVCLAERAVKEKWVLKSGVLMKTRQAGHLFSPRAAGMIQKRTSGSWWPPCWRGASESVSRWSTGYFTPWEVLTGPTGSVPASATTPTGTSGIPWPPWTPCDLELVRKLLFVGKLVTSWTRG